MTEAPPAFNFENAIGSSGISFVLDNSWSTRRYQVETMAGGVGLFDYNNDGLLDIYFANGAQLPSMGKTDPRFYNRLYRNNGNGTFTDVTTEAGVEGKHYAMVLPPPIMTTMAIKIFSLPAPTATNCFTTMEMGPFPM